MRPPQPPRRVYGAVICAADASLAAQVAFLRRVYQHLAVCLIVFGGLLYGMLHVPRAQAIVDRMLGTELSWVVLAVGFFGVAAAANSWAARAEPPQMAYIGLSLYVVTQAVLFMPLIYAAAHLLNDPKVFFEAIGSVILVFGGLTGYVLLTEEAFSFARSLPVIGGFSALSVALAAGVFGLSAGVWFSVAMAAFATGIFAYETATVMDEYPPDRHVAATLALLSSVTRMLWNVLRVMNRR